LFAPSFRIPAWCLLLLLLLLLKRSGGPGWDSDHRSTCVALAVSVLF
jgi:hypothetical protein